ncbi:MAG: GNAT family N-acetyltransferase [Clostridia bacterium]|nr:GNAT family N-acetyltransferase [Clostridia bacterium]
MVNVVEVKTKKQQKEFLNFPLRMYKNNPYFVPPLYADEAKIFRKDYVYYDTSEAVYFLAERDGKTVGRISGILQRSSNEKWDQKRVRFTRFDCIDDAEVAKALFDAVENFAKERGMTEVVGPLGFSDLEREGLLIDGFEELSTFEEQYNFPYYGKLIEACGYGKEVDWIESKLSYPQDEGGKMEKMADYIMKRYNLHFGEAKSTKDFLDRYADDFFDLLDRSYEKIYGTVPFTDGMKKMMMDNFKLIININYVAVVLDENNKAVCLGLCFPSLAKAMQKSKGHLTPAALIRVLNALRHPKIIDLALVGVDPEYENRGISTVVVAELMKMLRDRGVDYAETNLNLEDNYSIRNAWKRFDQVEHKRRRSYVKSLAENEK